MAKKSPRRHSDEFKQETVDLVLKQGYSVADAARAVGITPALLYKWKAKLTEQPILNDDEKAEASIRKKCCIDRLTLQALTLRST